jgi:hypothetical protein
MQNGMHSAVSCVASVCITAMFCRAVEQLVERITTTYQAVHVNICVKTACVKTYTYTSVIGTSSCRKHNYYNIRGNK